ncbi:MAG TPA: cation transporter [Acidimicrobiia bacterium]|nr:cation transporter [Acidimicrobiia bacterium]
MSTINDFKAARRVSEISVAWTVGASIAAIAIGTIDGSGALIVFGAIGFVDAIGSVALVHHFRHGLRHEELSDRFEQRAHRIVRVGLLLVGVAAVATNLERLLAGSGSNASVAAALLAGASLVVLTILSRTKIRIAARVGSAALRADGHLSGVGAGQAAVVLGGLAVTAAFGWEWADAVTAIIVGFVAIGLSTQG